MRPPYHARLAISQYGEQLRAELFTEDLGDTNGDLLPAKWQYLDDQFKSYLAMGAASLPPDAATKAGKEIFAYLLGGSENSAKWQEVRQQAERQGRHIRLLIDATTAEVRDLPYGLLCDPYDDFYLLRESEIQFVRIIRRCTPRLLHLDKPRLRMLLASAEPEKLPTFDGAQRLLELARGLPGKFDLFGCTADGVQLIDETSFGPADGWTVEHFSPFLRTTRSVLKAALASDDFDILHVLAHGFGGGVIVCDNDGLRKEVTARELGEWCGVRRLQMAFLQVCKASKTESRGGFGGVAQQLLNPKYGNLAAVVASPYPVDAEHSQEAALSFYSAIAEGKSPDVALKRDLPETNWSWAFLELWVRPSALADTGTRGAFQFASPYKGLARFEARDAEIFFGRDAETSELIQILQHETVVAVVGDSGSGKSSLLHAGLTPQIKSSGLVDRADWRIVSLTPGVNPSRALAAALAREGTTPREAGGADATFEELQRTLAATCGPANPLVIFFNQFEEIFTLCADESERNTVSNALAWAAEAYRDHFRLVLDMRSEYIGRVAALPGLRAMIDRPWVLKPPTPDKVRDIVEQPASECGYTFQGPLKDSISRHRKSLLERILNDPLLTNTGGTGLGRNEPNTSAPLPLLEFALERLWLSAVNRGAQEFTHEDFDQLGGLGGAITKHAEDVFTSLKARPEFQEASQVQPVAEKIFTGLVATRGVTPTRRPRSRRDIEVETGHPELASKVVDCLVGERLLAIRSDPEDIATTQLEITHEVLVRSWERFQRWLLQDTEKRAMIEKFQEHAREWNEGTGGGTSRNSNLPTPRVAKKYLEWVDDEQPSLTEQQVEFVNALRVYPLSRMRGVGTEFIDMNSVSEAGWGVVVSQDSRQEVLEALEPLIHYRRNQVPDDRFGILDYRQGESWRDWLIRHGVYPGNVIRRRIPHYLMLVGPPTKIPFSFQYLLAAQYAVGRLDFDTPDDYRCYAHSVVQYETEHTVSSQREIVFWGPRHAADYATQMSCDKLMAPLTEGDARQAAIAAVLLYHSNSLIANQASKANLVDVLHRSEPYHPPAMLVTAAHGVAWPMDHENQRGYQGALLCQDWSGFGNVDLAHYLAAADIRDDARVQGLVAFIWSDYSAGTPTHDNYPKERDDRGRIADVPFTSALAKRLLSHPNGAALAVIGLVERASSYSIRPPGLSDQPVNYRTIIGRILCGERLGSAIDQLSERCALFSMELAEELDVCGSEDVDLSPLELSYRWIERNSYRNSILLGDPAVRLRVDRLVGVQ